MANPQYHPIPPFQSRSKKLKRTAASKLDWNSPKRPNRTPRAEYAFMGRYALICGTHPHQPAER